MTCHICIGLMVGTEFKKNIFIRNRKRGETSNLFNKTSFRYRYFLKIFNGNFCTRKYTVDSLVDFSKKNKNVCLCLEWPTYKCTNMCLPYRYIRTGHLHDYVHWTFGILVLTLDTCHIDINIGHMLY